MVSADRQLIMETNRSLRNIKNELENLLERGVIDEAAFDELHAALPDESPLSGPLRIRTGGSATNKASAAPQLSPSPVPSDEPKERVLYQAGVTPNRNPHTSPPPQHAPPTKAFGNMHIQSQEKSPAPPSYDETPPPNLPQRGGPPGKPVVAHARALYAYVAGDGRDLSFQKDDKIAVHEYMNQDWWMGRNLTTGQEGIFPRNYVFVEHENKPPGPPQPQYGYPAQHQNQQHNPYNTHAPPMAMANGSGSQPQEQGEGEKDNKVGEYGKKFGKKLGNAAIFGAGATIGGNIVNSIF